MSLNIIDAKLKVIQRTLNNWELKAIEREFSESLSRLNRSYSSARSLRGILFTDLIYALIKHSDWYQTSVFSALLVEFLQYDHNLARTDAEFLVHHLIEIFLELKIGKSRSICIDDREFLTWAYVCAASAEGEEALEGELGLGTAVLNKLKDGIAALERVDSKIFIPEYDAMLASIILELGHETKSTPWAMDLHRLKFALLSSCGDNAQAFILEEQLPKILNALVRIGLGEVNVLQDRPTLIESLLNADLVILGIPKGKKQKSLELSDMGFRLTAQLFESSFHSQWSVSDFCKLNPRWQLAVLRRSSALDIESLQSILFQKVNHLAPEVIELAMIRLLDIDSSSLKGESLKNLLQDTKFAWHKAAIFRALRTTRPNQDLLRVVADELINDTTTGIRIAASSLLDAWTEQ